MAKFYVYTLAEPDIDEYGSSRVFYVGKGCKDRVHEHEPEARKGHKCHKCNRIRKIWASGKGIEKNIVFETDDEILAFRYEVQLIAKYGLKNLTNVEPGGPKRAQKFSRPRPEGRIIDISDADWSVHLWRAPGMTRKQHSEMMEVWRLKKREAVERALRRARFNQRMNDMDMRSEIERLEILLEEVDITLGNVDQLELPINLRELVSK